MRAESCAPAKVTRPVFAQVYPRKRLFDLLDRSRKIVWVCGPPGSGKTTVVTSYLEEKQLSCIWYQVDACDADPATFFYYMGLAAKRSSPRKRKPLPLLTPEYLSGLPTFTLRFFENYYHRFKAPFWVVFDNYQEAPVDPVFHDVMRYGLSIIPEGIKVVLISRGEIPLTLVHLQANNLMDRIGWQDLRLTKQEAVSIVELVTARKPPEKAVAHMHETTDGWLAGLMLMLKTVAIEQIDPYGFSKVPVERIFDYFAGEVLKSIDEESRLFLLKTSFLPKMTLRMVEQMTQMPSAGRLLAHLFRNHYFMERRFHSSPTYTYHPLFREFLLHKATETLGSQTVLDLRRRAADLLEATSQTEDAVALLLESSDWMTLARLILKNAPALLEQGRHQVLEGWLNKLPADVFDQLPWLHFWMGACTLSYDPARSQTSFEKAYDQFVHHEDTAGVFLSWAGAVNAIVYASEAFRSLDRWIDMLATIMERFGPFPTPEIKARVASSMFMAMTYRKPEDPELEVWAQRVLSVKGGAGVSMIKIQTLVYLFRHHTHTGHRDKSTAVLNLIRHLPLHYSSSDFSRILILLADAIHFASTGAYNRCRATVAKGLALSSKSGMHVMDFVMLTLLIICALEEHDLVTADKKLKQMEGALDHRTQLDLAYYHQFRAREALIRKDAKKARHHADLSLKYNIRTGDLLGRRFNDLLTAYVFNECGEHSRAADFAEQLIGKASERGDDFIEANALLISAQSAFDQGESALGVKRLHKALTLLKNTGHCYSLWDMPAKTAALLVRALEEGIEVEYVQSIIRQRHLVPDVPPVHLDNWPWAIQIFTFGRFEILTDRKPLRFSKKAPKKPLEILKLLTTSIDGAGFRKDYICDLLWPEADGDKAQQSFDTTVHRLRKLLGYDKAVVLREGKLRLDLRYCWVDSLSFGRLVKLSQKEAKRDGSPGGVRALERAVALYKGPFLPDEQDASWVIPAREDLEKKYRKAVNRIGGHL